MHEAARSAILSTVKRKWSWCLQLLLPGFKVFQEFWISAEFSTQKNINWFVSPVPASTLGPTWKEKSSCAQNKHERNERNETDCQTTNCICVPKSKYSWNPGLLQLYTGACSPIFNALIGKKRCLVPAFIKVWSRIWNIWLLLQRIIN
jgi:hypothetical protein